MSTRRPTKPHHRIGPEWAACSVCGNREQEPEECFACEGTGEVEDHWEWPYCHDCNGRGDVWVLTCFCEEDEDD